ncbi:hypothetical protein JCM10213v2_004135 [Rhodosporidiobolus nylandii]
MSDDADVLAEIARLTSAIQQHRATPPFAPRGRGRGRGRGGYTGGRGAAKAAGAGQHRNATWTAPGVAPLPPARRSGTSTPVEGSSTAVASGSRPVTPGAGLAPFAASQGLPGRSGGVTPVSAQMGNLGLGAAAGKGKEKAPQQQQGEREVVIDGVVFVADARGNKLVRKPDADPSDVLPPSPSPAAPGSPSLTGTPKRTSHLGTTYIRTKSGNLVSLAFARKRKEQADARRKVEEEMRAKGERLDKLVGIVKGYTATRTKPAKPKSDKPCRFFQRTGQCTRAHTCPYVHDSTRIAICPLFLRSSCPRPASSCPLSHSPNAHRSPHCVHFPSCTRPSCPYAHVQVSADAGVCRDFVEYGWCAAGEDCGKRHVRECWRFAETGECNVQGCREPHVLRRKHDAAEEDEEDEEGEEGSSSGEEEGDIENEGAVLGAESAAAGVKRKRRESTDASVPAGISGAAGRRLKKLKAGGKNGDFTQQQDFVQLLLPISDDEEDEDEDEEEDEEEDEGMSVDEEDLASETEEEKAQPDAELVEQVHLVKKDPPPALADADELDYGLSDDEDDAVQIEQLLRR